MKPGSVLLITDHMRLLTRFDPLKDLQEESLINMDNLNEETPWSSRVNEIARKVAKELGIKIFEGTYVWTSGPSYVRKTI